MNSPKELQSIYSRVKYIFRLIIYINISQLQAAVKTAGDDRPLFYYLALGCVPEMRQWSCQGVLWAESVKDGFSDTEIGKIIGAIFH
jgi:hypothetical protein